MAEEDRWVKLEEIVRRVVREEIAQLGKKPKIEIVNGRWVGVTEEQREAWKAAFPGVDVDAELKKMAAWIVSNPMMAPKSQYGRFAHSWLTKTQNQASLRSIPTERKTESRQAYCAYCERVATGNIGGIWSCDSHSKNAMDREPRRHMLGVVPKPVAGVE